MTRGPHAWAGVSGLVHMNRVAAAEKTTNETFARKLLGESAGERFVPYGGSGAYDRMLADLVAERIDGASRRTYAQ